MIKIITLLTSLIVVGAVHKDWLIQPIHTTSTVKEIKGENGKMDLILSNGLITRKFIVQEYGSVQKYTPSFSAFGTVGKEN